MSPESCQVFPLVSVSVKLPAEPFRQPSIVDDELSLVLVVDVVVVVCVVLELVSGVVDWLGEVVEGDVVLGVVDCGLLGDVGVLCAATQTADRSRIAVIRYSFLIVCPPMLSACTSCGPLRRFGSSATDLDRRTMRRFALKQAVRGKKAEQQERSWSNGVAERSDTT